MNIFYVNQGKSFEIESEMGFIWSPRLNSKGNRNAGYTMMTRIKKR